MAKKIIEQIPENQMSHITLGGITFFWTTDADGFALLRKIRLPYAEATVDINMPYLIQDEETGQKSIIGL